MLLGEYEGFLVGKEGGWRFCSGKEWEVRKRDRNFGSVFLELVYF